MNTLNEAEKEANRFAVCAKDCEDAIRYLESAIELRDLDAEEGRSRFWDAGEACLVAAIISYARAFVKSKHDGSSVSIVKLDVRTMLNGNADMIALHEIVLAKRHKAAAHSDWEERSSDRMDDSAGGGVMRHHTRVRYGQNIVLEEFNALATATRDYFRWEMHDRDRMHPKPPADPS